MWASDVTHTKTVNNSPCKAANTVASSHPHNLRHNALQNRSLPRRCHCDGPQVEGVFYSESLNSRSTLSLDLLQLNDHVVIIAAGSVGHSVQSA